MKCSKFYLQLALSFRLVLVTKRCTFIPAFPVVLSPFPNSLPTQMCIGMMTEIMSSTMQTSVLMYKMEMVAMSPWSMEDTSTKASTHLSPPFPSRS